MRDGRAHGRQWSWSTGATSASGSAPGAGSQASWWRTTWGRWLRRWQRRLGRRQQGRRRQAATRRRRRPSRRGAPGPRVWTFRQPHALPGDLRLSFTVRLRGAMFDRLLPWACGPQLTPPEYADAAHMRWNGVRGAPATTMTAAQCAPGTPSAPRPAWPLPSRAARGGCRGAAGRCPQIRSLSG